MKPALAPLIRLGVFQRTDRPALSMILLDCVRSVRDVSRRMSNGIFDTTHANSQDRRFPACGRDERPSTPLSSQLQDVPCHFPPGTLDMPVSLRSAIQRPADEQGLSLSSLSDSAHGFQG